MRKYEIVFVVDPDVEKDKVDEIVDKYSKVIVNNGGEVEKVERWGMRRLAYKINKKTKGEYIRMEYRALPHVPKEIENLMRRDELIMRFLTVRLKDKIEGGRISSTG